MRVRQPLLLASLASLVHSDVLISQPAAGASIPAGSIPIAWADSGVAPALSTLTTYQIALMAGGNDAASSIVIQMLVPNGAFAAGSVAQGVVPAAQGGPGQNAYYLKVTSISSQGGTVINYSKRFTLTGMTGKFPAAVQQGVTANAGAVAGPATENNVANNVGAVPAAGAGNDVPYSLQTGLTRYAPMQGVPPTKITAKTATPLFPTSAFTVATTYLPNPIAVTTMTASQTFSVSSQENPAAAASQPVGNNAAQQRFLERWKD